MPLALTTTLTRPQADPARRLADEFRLTFPDCVGITDAALTSYINEALGVAPATAPATATDPTHGTCAVPAEPEIRSCTTPQRGLRYVLAPNDPQASLLLNNGGTGVYRRHRSEVFECFRNGMYEDQYGSEEEALNWLRATAT